MPAADSSSSRRDRSRSRSSSSPTDHVSRRTLLATAGTAVASALAGCSALGNATEAPTFHDGDWHSYGNGPTNTNRVAGGAPKPTDQETLTTAGWTYVPPVVHDDVVYFAADRSVSAIAIDGTEKWSRLLAGRVTGAPALDPDRDRLYVPTDTSQTTDGSEMDQAVVTALSLTDGTTVAQFGIGDGRTYGITVVDGAVYARNASACVRLTPDGTEQWRCPLDPLTYDEYNLGDYTATQVAPAVVDNGVYVSDRDAVVKLDPETGEERWCVPVDTAYAASVVDEGGVVQTGWQETVSVDHSGDVRWRRDLHTCAAAAASNGDIYVAASDLYELDGASGETNWQTRLSHGGSGTAAPVVTDTDVLVASGNLLTFRRDMSGILPASRKRWEFSSVHATEFVSPVVAAGRVFTVGPHGLQYAWSGTD